MYNGYLYHLSNTDQRWTVDAFRKFEKVEKLKKRRWSGPKFVKVNFTASFIKHKLKLNDYEVKELGKLLDETDCLFQELEEQGVMKNRLMEIDNANSWEGF